MAASISLSIFMFPVKLNATPSNQTKCNGSVASSLKNFPFFQSSLINSCISHPSASANFINVETFAFLISL